MVQTDPGECPETTRTMESIERQKLQPCGCFCSRTSRFSINQTKILHGNQIINSITVIMLAICLTTTDWSPLYSPSGNHQNHLKTRLVEAVSVQRLNVPDLVVIDQQQANQGQYHQSARSTDMQHRTAAGQSNTYNNGVMVIGGQQHSSNNNNNNHPNQPEAASLINSNLDQLNSREHQQQQPQVTFECLISFDKKKDKNLIIKWHHDERVEPIYQWIPELNKRSIAPQYRAYIAPIVGPPTTSSNITSISGGPNVGLNTTASSQSNQIQLLEAGFRLIRPSKELGGKYTCSAISVQNDDSKSKKMIVFTPPRSFRFNASRTDIGALLANQRDRLIQLTQPATHLNPYQANPSTSQLPLPYRMRGFDASQLATTHSHPPGTTLSPQMYSTIDYVNVNQQRARLQTPPTSWSGSSQAPPNYSSLFSMDPTRPPTPHASYAAGGTVRQVKLQPQRQTGIKLVCDIDQVFPVPEVSIYRIAKLDGSYPDKLAKLDTRVERDVSSGLFHVQVTSILDDEELEARYGLNEPIYFECLIALTNLELSRYADNKRSIIYSTSAQHQLQQLATDATKQSESVENSATPLAGGLLSTKATILTWPVISLTITLVLRNYLLHYHRHL